MALFGSKAPGFYRVLKVQAADEASFNGSVASFKDKAPDILGYTGTKVRVVQTGPAEGLMIVEGRDALQMETHVSMMEELRNDQVSKFGLTIESMQGKVIWAS